MITVYGLTDEHGQIRYVGATERPAARFKQHLKGRCGSLFSIHGMAVLSKVDTEMLSSHEEQAWINYFGMDNLFNIANPRPWSEGLLNDCPITLYQPAMQVCPLDGCEKTFTPVTTRQRFCCQKHRDRWHHLERSRLLKMLREMGIGK